MATLRVLASYEPKIAKICILACNSANKPPFLNLTRSRYAQCSIDVNVLKVASVGGGDIANLQACHFSRFQFQLCHQRSLLKCHYTFYICRPLVKKVSFRFLICCALADLSSNMFRRCPPHVLPDILSDNSRKGACFKNLNDTFLTNWP